MELSYLTRVLRGMRLEKMNHCIDTVHERCGKPKAAIFFDMLGCAAKYGAGYYDYMIFAFYDMTAAERGHLHDPDEEPEAAQNDERSGLYESV